ncbi:hypothetical protein B1207_06370 [Legionella quinlivanii]|uniref:Uncharacterized protein n=2 Tax=Legionella quinlivanii TaxID=45073 RepID=A0A364LKC6_9GAMM|nr:hypothetical protein B1207_06370 [Legionella quinlivanii]
MAASKIEVPTFGHVMIIGENPIDGSTNTFLLALIRNLQLLGYTSFWNLDRQARTLDEEKQHLTRKVAELGELVPKIETIIRQSKDKIRELDAAGTLHDQLQPWLATLQTECVKDDLEEFARDITDIVMQAIRSSSVFSIAALLDELDKIQNDVSTTGGPFLTTSLSLISELQTRGFNYRAFQESDYNPLSFYGALNLFPKSDPIIQALRQQERSVILYCSTSKGLEFLNAMKKKDKSLMESISVFHVCNIPPEGPNLPVMSLEMMGPGFVTIINGHRRELRLNFDRYVKSLDGTNHTQSTLSEKIVACLRKKRRVELPLPSPTSLFFSRKTSESEMFQNKTLMEEPHLNGVIIGSRGAGKTSLALRLSGKIFCETLEPTKGVGFYCIKGKDRVDICDVSSEETLLPMYTRRAHICVLVFDVHQKDSIDVLKKWLNIIKKNCKPDVKILLVRTKMDLSNDCVISPEEIQTLVKEWNIAEDNHFQIDGIHETSAKSLKGIANLKDCLTNELGLSHTATIAGP